jgi:hypothetical protein
MVRTGATLADAATEWLRNIEHDRERKPSTVGGYRSIVRAQLLPEPGGVRRTQGSSVVPLPVTGSLIVAARLP